MPHAIPTNSVPRVKRVDDRPSACKRGYGRKWQRLRKMKLARRPMCECCGSPANEVDHIVALSRGGTNAMDNLQSLCRSCHSRKTVAEDGGFGGGRMQNRWNDSSVNRSPSTHFSRPESGGLNG